MPRKEAALREVTAILKPLGAKILLDAKRCALPGSKFGRFEQVSELDLLLVLGGDGTILRSIREMDDHSVPLLAVNRGTIGFLAELSLSEVKDLLPKLLKGEGMIDERHLLDINAFRGKTLLLSGRVLNEAVISQGAISRLIDLQTSVNRQPLTTFHADGVIIAPPTGSTAYSLAAGGPIVHPDLPAIILTPINPHSFSQKPIVIPADQIIDVAILTKRNKFADVQISLTLDGQTYISLIRGDRVEAKTSRKTVKFLRRKEDTFFATLRSKLKWGERLEDE